MPVSRNSMENYPETSSSATRQGTFGQSSQLGEPLWTDPGIKSEISVRELIFTLRKKVKNSRTFPKRILASEEKASMMSILSYSVTHVILSSMLMSSGQQLCDTTSVKQGFYVYTMMWSCQYYCRDVISSMRKSCIPTVDVTVL